MAQKVHIVLVDGLDGTTYEIDLNDKNAAALRDALGGYVGHARKVGGARRGRKTATANGDGTSAKEIRDWARANGHQVPDRGRVSAEVREAYAKAH